MVTHQLRDAFYVATHMATDAHDEVGIVARHREKDDEAEFIMLREGVIAFEGDADALRARRPIRTSRRFCVRAHQQLTCHEHVRWPGRN